ncbi:MAG: thiamine pyrophosphate-dependent enzyme [Candidatus Bipolaricaulota bacterium]|nr:thiamine pyrophosphate-dependent enzyme [Candidatus Bipolaricaulota bacterium]
MPKTETMTKVFARPRSLTEKKFTYCPGCHHGLITRILGGAIDKLGIQERTVVVAPVGCAVFAYEWFRCDGVQAAHGRAAAVATGIKRANPDLVVISYQGDGDLAAIGTAETIHAANRGEAITVIFVNNQIYGMTGGQMAPTTLDGQATTSSPRGRDPATMGHPLRVAEMIAALQAPMYVTRQALYDAKHIAQATRAVEKALRYQVEKRGYSLVEILANCPTGWKMPPVKANEHIAATVTGVFPLGDLVDRG